MIDPVWSRSCLYQCYNSHSLCYCSPYCLQKPCSHLGAERLLQVFSFPVQRQSIALMVQLHRPSSYKLTTCKFKIWPHQNCSVMELHSYSTVRSGQSQVSKHWVRLPKWLLSQNGPEKTHTVQDVLPKPGLILRGPNCGLIRSGILSRAANKQIISWAGKRWEGGVWKPETRHRLVLQRR